MKTRGNTIKLQAGNGWLVLLALCAIGCLSWTVSKSITFGIGLTSILALIVAAMLTFGKVTNALVNQVRTHTKSIISKNKHTRRTWLVVAVVVVGGLIFQLFFRYKYIPIGGQYAVTYKVDRLTGQTWTVTPLGTIPVKDK